MTVSTAEIRDGSKLLMRPIEPGDKDALADAFDRLSAESRYRRFFAPLNRLSTTDLKYLTEVDHSNHEAIVAFDAETGGTAGVARYVRSPDPAIAEVAVTVIDDWQGRGVATALLEQLIERAREEGITHFIAVILEENEAAIELFEGLAANDPSPHRKDGNLELLIELPTEGLLGETVLGRALHAAASGVTINPWRLLKHRIQETAEHVQPAIEEDQPDSGGP